MSRRKFFQLITVATLLLITLTLSPTLASPPTLGEGSPGVGIQSAPWEPVLCRVSSPGRVAASAPLSATTDSTGDIRINEVMFYPDTGGNEWVELKNTGSAPVNISGYSITDEDGNMYRIPDALPDVPGGAFVVVTFDGAGSGSDDYDFSDNVATLHTPPGLVDIFEDDADQCALYNVIYSIYVYLPLVLKNYVSWNPPVPEPPSDFPTPPIVAFVAWGAEPGGDAGNASVAGIWSEGWYVSLARGLGEESSEASLVPNESIGLLPDSETGHPDDWTLFQAGEVTQGGQNSSPVISWYYPAPGATVDSETFTISWNAVHGATGYRFQMDDNIDFSSPTVDTTLTEPAYIPTSPVPEGTYYWRVKVVSDGSESSWSPGVEIHSLTLPSPRGSSLHPAQLSDKVLGITWQLQHKDTNMLCLDGDAETGNEPWNAPHSVRGTHGRNYCVRASVSMIASYYGGNLSQDRITYETFKGGGPEGDLGHDVPFTGVQARASLSWALGTNVPAQFGKPTFAQIKAWIDADRPMRAVIPGHSRALDGYLEFDIGITSWQFLHILDPWDRAKWVSYADDNIIYVQVGPAGTRGAPNVRSDEDVDSDGTADTMDDSDGDGVCDFDESNRFSLVPNDSDSDDDLVQDQADIREYVFDATVNFSPRNPDIDGDGKRKELDPDNDYAANDGTMDGCEDSDQDGKYESDLGETDNFKPSDDKTLHIRLTWPQLGSDVDLHLIKPGAAMWSGGDCYYGNLHPDWGIPGTCGDPTLDVDCITQCTVENIRLDKLESGTYSIKLHYYWDHDLGPTSPRVTMWVQQTRYDFGPRQMTDDQVWDVCTVEWPSMVVTSGGLVTSQSSEERPLRAEK